MFLAVIEPKSYYVNVWW